MPANEVEHGSFTLFLAWLDPQPDAAGQKYRQLHGRLCALFEYWRCADPEGLSDITLGRASRKVDFFRNQYHGDPWAYIRSIAWNVHREEDKQRRRSLALDEHAPIAAPALDGDGPIEKERALGCLEKCRDEVLTADEARLISEYYGAPERIAHRKALARTAGVPQATLRKRTERCRRRLEQCVRDCLGTTNASHNRQR